MALTKNWKDEYGVHIPITFNKNYKCQNEGGICHDGINEKHPSISININAFNGNQSDYIDDYTFISTIVTIFHESRHMNNFLKHYTFTRDDPEECRQMALSYLVHQGSDIFYYSNYYNDPMEIDAEEYGVLAACEYLKENFPNNNYEELILDYVNSSSDASEYYFFTLFENDKLTRINDIPKIYDNAFAESKNKAKTYFTSKYDSKHSLRCLLDKKLIEDECWLARAHIEGTKNHEANKMIASLILHHYPEYLKKLPSLRNIDFTPEHYFDKDMLPDVLMKRSHISQLKSKILQAKNNEQEIDASER